MMKARSLNICPTSVALAIAFVHVGEAVELVGQPMMYTLICTFHIPRYTLHPHQRHQAIDPYQCCTMYSGMNLFRTTLYVVDNSEIVLRSFHYYSASYY